jgi:hypothetical protein
MGNCLRMPEDHTSLLPIPSNNYPSMTVPTSASNSTSTTSDTSIPKVKTEIFIFLFLKNLKFNY